MKQLGAPMFRAFLFVCENALYCIFITKRTQNALRCILVTIFTNKAVSCILPKEFSSKIRKQKIKPFSTRD